MPRTRLDFAYDAEGRRTSKTVFTNWSGSVYLATNLTRFIYDPGIQTGGEWNLLAEVNHTNKVLRSYVWGLDLTGILETDGNIGGLLMVVDHTGGSAVCHFAAYDGNGNLTALVKTDQTVAARYEYGPFGEPIRLTGPLAKANPFRWSTKFTDEESGLVDYGYRLYSPSLGRWISRDPIEEEGGNNLYAFVENGSINGIDKDGRIWAFLSRHPGFHRRLLIAYMAFKGLVPGSGLPNIAAEMQKEAARVEHVSYERKSRARSLGKGAGAAAGLVVAFGLASLEALGCGLEAVADVMHGVRGDSTTMEGNLRDMFRSAAAGDQAWADLDAVTAAILGSGGEAASVLVMYNEFDELGQAFGAITSELGLELPR